MSKSEAPQVPQLCSSVATYSLAVCRLSAGTSLLLTVASRAGLAAVGEQLLRWPGLDLRQADRQGRDAVGLAIRVKNAKFGVSLLARWAGWEA